ncbi:MAG: hypothetical protein ACXVHM_08205 [Methanobacterium sp.]
MVKLGKGTAIIISVMIGIILLYLFGINGIFALVVLGFAATYLTTPGDRSYKIGGFAGIILAILIFVIELFIWPPLPVNPPTIPASVMTGLQLTGIFELIFGLIFTMVIFFLFGALGGVLAQKIFKEKVEKPRAHTRRNINKKESRKPQRTLNRTFKN